MKFRRVFSTVTCAILAYWASSSVVLGQTVPTAERPLADSSGDSQSLFLGAMVDRPPDAGCGDLGFGQSCSSRWTVSAEFVILERIGSVPYTLVETVPGSVPYDDLPNTAGTPVLNASDFRHGFCGGPRLGLIHHGDDGHDLEVSYLQIDGWDSYRAVGPTPNDWLVMRAPSNFLQTQNETSPPFTQAMVWDYTSRLYNAEVNMRWNPWDRVTLLAGFRWVNLTEELVGNLTPPTAHGTGPFWDTQTKNNLYGLQIGADAKLLERNRFSIDGVLKVGLYDNHADETTSVRMLRLQYAESASTDHLAFVGEIGVQCKYRITSRLSLKAGYEAIWLGGVALAPGQIVETDCHGGLDPWGIYVQPLGVNCSSDVFLHGATAGLEYAF